MITPANRASIIHQDDIYVDHHVPAIVLAALSDHTFNRQTIAQVHKSC